MTKICITLQQLDFFFFFEDFIIHRFETLPVIVIKGRGAPQKEQWWRSVGVSRVAGIEV